MKKLLLAAAIAFILLLLCIPTVSAAPGTSISGNVTINPHWIKTYDWTIEKSVDQPTLTLSLGQSYASTYTVVVNKTNGIEEAWNDGQICVNNDGAVSTDNLTITADLFYNPGGGYNYITTVPVDISSNPVLDPNETGCYYYWIAISPLAGSYKVTANVTILNHSGHDTIGTPTGPHPSANCTFPSAVNDECVNVTDSLVASVNQKVCDNTSFTYTHVTGPYGTCGEYTVDNTASFVSTVPENADNTGSSDATVSVHVPCAGGCTLSGGYWMTHSELGPASYDDTWAKLPDGEDTWFYNSGQTYIQVLHTPPTKGNCYYILSFQYIAAELNVLNGAATTPAVGAAMSRSDTFFKTYTPTAAGALKGSSPVRAQAIADATLLSNYNLGLIGPGHCSE
jgi:hypothetical protein